MNGDKTVAVAFAGAVAGIKVTAPNGGEIWKAGKANTITWTFTGNPGPYVKIELLKGGKLGKAITTKTKIGSAGSGSYQWKIPLTQALRSDYAIRVTSKSNGAYSDTSDGTFTVAK
jgi:hypothetical protein